MEQVPLPEAITRFLDDLRRAERSAPPHRARLPNRIESPARLPRRASRHGGRTPRWSCALF